MIKIIQIMCIFISITCLYCQEDIDLPSDLEDPVLEEDIDLPSDLEDPVLEDNIDLPSDLEEPVLDDNIDLPSDLEDPVLEDNIDLPSDLEDPVLEDNIDLPSDLEGPVSLPSDLESIPNFSDLEDSRQAHAEENKREQTFRDWLDTFPFEISGFVEGIFGIRPQNDPLLSRDVNVGEIRFQLSIAKYYDNVSFHIKSDFYYDGYEEKPFVDLREAKIVFHPLDSLYISVGRQILSWGVSEGIFINDLFPKDFPSSFIGRDDVYFKAPSNAIRVDWNAEFAQLSFVYSPLNDEDRYIRGKRISFVDPLGIGRGEDERLPTDEPNRWFRDNEFAWRILKNIDGYELAFYGYYGYYKSPAGFDLNKNKFNFPRLFVHGTSLRGQIFDGIASFEFGYYYSREDTNGDDPLITNSQLRFLVGYEYELLSNFVINIQYYVNFTLQYDALEDNFIAGQVEPEEALDFIIVSANKSFLRDKYNLNMFAYYSPVESDAYLQPVFTYKPDDNWRLEIGANIFFGKENDTTFGQLERNSNIFASIRWTF
ncbi:hypothetical protein [Candidatus Uabimicrobium sp. HlEnr_7]|uniref:hypothetical protein n=1 Tax=Candidatus Uabimicrobium helgolandensis TaxID=3095367 RepID=UPI003558B6EE